MTRGHFGSKFWKKFAVSSAEELIDGKCFCVKYWNFFGRMLPLLMKEHWFAKKEKKNFQLFYENLL